MRKLAKLMLTAALIIPFAAGLPVRAMAVQSMDQPAQNMKNQICLLSVKESRACQSSLESLPISILLSTETGAKDFSN